jgi:branched-chain amino acid aminotransferase
MIVCIFVIQHLRVMNEYYGKNFILNGKLLPVELFDNSLVYEGESIYEILRMVRGIPVFFNDHMDRMSESLKHQNRKALAGIPEIKRSIFSLKQTIKKKDINLKIVFNFNKGSENYLVYFIEPIYPSAEQYRKGVKGILYFAQRKDPESKIINHNLRSSIYQKLINEGAYEALLVNRENMVTEGSRSNIFFLKDDTLTTAPDNVILNGITRKYILKICHEKQINVDFACVNADDILQYDAIFMTGTSPMVLPFFCIGDKYFNVKLPVIKLLRQLYIQKAEESAELFRLEL